MTPLKDSDVFAVSTGTGTFKETLGKLKLYVNPGAIALGGLSDVTLTGPAANQFLRFNGTRWVNQAVALATKLDDFTDVTISGPPSAGQVLRFNGTQWINESVALTGAQFITQLQDVAITSPTANQMLGWNGTKWANMAVQAPLSDSTTSTSTVVGASSKAVNDLRQAAVAKAGDTMTGNLTMAADTNVTVNRLGVFMALGKAPNTNFLYGESNAGATFGLRFLSDNNSYFSTSHELISAATALRWRVKSGGEFDLDSSRAYLSRQLLVKSNTWDSPSLTLIASENDLSRILMVNRTNEHMLGEITAGWTRTDFIGRVQTWIRSGVYNDGSGHVEINGGWREWEAVRFSRGGQYLGAIDGNGSYIDKTTFYLSARTLAPEQGLEAVKRLKPVRYRLQAPLASLMEQDRLGFLPYQLREVVPDAVTPDGTGVATSTLIPVLVKAVQELSAKVEELTARIHSVEEAF